MQKKNITWAYRFGAALVFVTSLLGIFLFAATLPLLVKGYEFHNPTVVILMLTGMVSLFLSAVMSRVLHHLD